MATKNPFTLFGINQDLIKRLSDPQVRSVIDSQYRTLQSIYHPDKPTGDETKSRELNEAYSLLSDPELYKKFKKSFLRTTYQKRVSELEEALLDSGLQLDHLNARFFNYLINLTNEDSAPNLNSCSIHLRDYTNTISAMKAERKEQEKFFFDYEITKNGKITKIQRKKRLKLPNKRLIGSFDEAIGQTSYSEDTKRLGYMDSRSYPSELTRLTRGHSKHHSKDISVSDIHLLLPHLTPKLKEWNYLLSLNLEGNEPRFEIDGQILEIQRK